MNKNQLLKIILAIFILTTISCKKATEDSGKPAKTTFDLGAAKTLIETGYREFETAFNEKDSKRLANCYTTDAKFMQPNDTTFEGRSNIQELFVRMMKGDSPKIKLSLVELWGNENNLTAENTWSMTDKDGKVVDEGKSIEVYKMEDGKWRLFRDCYNSNMPGIPMAK